MTHDIAEQMREEASEKRSALSETGGETAPERSREIPSEATLRQAWSSLESELSAERNRTDEINRRLAAIIESSDDAIISKDLNGIITSWNTGAERIFGYKPDEVIGQCVTILMPPERWNEEPGILDQIRRGQRVDHYETVRRRKDGTLLDVSLTVSPVKNAAGKVIGVSKVARDITERRRAERRLSVQFAVNQVLLEAETIEETFSGLLRGIGEKAGWEVGNVWLVDKKARVLRCVEQWQSPRLVVGEFTRLSRELTFAKGHGLPGRVWEGGTAAWVNDLDQDPNLPRKAAAAREGLQAGFAFPILGRNGVLGAVEFFSSGLRGIEPDFLQILQGIGRQVGQFLDRKWAEEALRQQGQVLKILNGVGNNLLGALDLESIAQAVADAGRAISGAAYGAFYYSAKSEGGDACTLRAVSGLPRDAFNQFPIPRKAELFEPTFPRVGAVRIADLAHAPHFGLHGPFAGQTQKRWPVRSYLAVPVVSKSGEMLGGLFFGHPDPDVFTEESESVLSALASQAAVAIDNAHLYQAVQRELIEHRRAEEALRRSEEALRSAQGALREHAEELEHRVQERTAVLQETIGELEAFSYSVSHDIRAPLRAMQGFADALLRDHASQLDERAQDYLRRIHRASSRLDLLIRDVLTYSRIAKADVILTLVDLNRFLPDIIQGYPEIAAFESHIELRQPLYRVLAHEAFLSQVVANLLGNALKFLKQGVPPRIAVWAEPCGEMIRLVFSDNGLGIAPEHQQRIFQIFGRVYSERRFEGTGIGLAIVKKAVERMGGKVGVESSLGVGSQFWLTLKRAE